MRFFAKLLPTKRAVYGGAAILMGLMPPTFPPPAVAADNRASQLPDLTPRDLIVTNQARRAIDKEEQLVPHNLGVTVKDKVATIWGTVPSEEVAKRAIEALKKINGIVDVVNECRIVPPADPVPLAVAEAVKKSLETGGDPALVKIVAVPRSTTTGRQIVAKPAPEVMPLAPLAHFDRTALKANPPAVVLLSPIVEDPANGRADSPEKLIRSDKRFTAVTLDVTAGIVKVNGIVPRMKDAWELAEKLNALPGIKQVILGYVHEK